MKSRAHPTSSMASHVEETLRLQFGTAATAVGTQLYAIEKANDGNPGLHCGDGKPRVLAFEAKGRIQRQVSVTQAVNRAAAAPANDQSQAAWGGGIQVFDQSPATTASVSAPHNELWNWDDFSDKNLVEIDGFRPHMPLHNFYEGQSASRDGSVSVHTMDMIEDRLRGVLEECDNLKLVQNFVDMDSSWGGLSYEVLAYLNEECPRAVVATFGTEWSYPLPDQSETNLYSTGIESRDKSKIEGRRCINMAASLASFVELSGVFIPVALNATTRRFPTSLGSNTLVGAATFAATAIEIAMSSCRAKSNSAYSLLEGLVPSTKVFELAARFPFSSNPSALLDDASAHSEAEQLKWSEHSLLPRLNDRRSIVFDSKAPTLGLTPPRFRRLHFRGDFESHALSLQGAIERVQSSDCVVQWTPEQLYIEREDSIDSVDAVSQLSVSSGVGQFLGSIATQISRSDKRILHEFTQAGMNVDALEEFEATLQAWSDAYPRQDGNSATAKSDPWDDEE